MRSPINGLALSPDTDAQAIRLRDTEGQALRADRSHALKQIAVAGFTDADLSIEAKENTLTIHGEKQTNDEEQTGDVLYQGIAARTFERSFQLADYVQVKGASLENGLLHVDLVREFPEAMKPRAIPITSSGKVLNVKVAA